MYVTRASFSPAYVSTRISYSGPNLEEELDEEDAMDLDEFYTDTDWT